MRLIARAYKLSQATAEMFVPKICVIHGTDCDCEKNGELELHHRDMNPFNTSPSNLEWRCRKTHEWRHGIMPNVNMPILMAEALESAEPQKYLEDTLNISVAFYDNVEKTVLQEKNHVFVEDEGIWKLAS